MNYLCVKPLEEAAFAAEEGEIPVGVLITCKGKIIARAHNQTERLQDCDSPCGNDCYHNGNSRFRREIT